MGLQTKADLGPVRLSDAAGHLGLYLLTWMWKFTPATVQSRLTPFLELGEEGE